MNCRALLLLACLFALACAPPGPGSDGGSGGGAGGGAGGGSADAGVFTTVRVHYPAGTQTVSLRGARPPLDWGTSVAMAPGADDTWTFTTTAVAAELEYKPLVNDVTWARGPNYKVLPGQTVDVYPHFFEVIGTWSKRWTSVTSALLSNSRPVWVYLPPGYGENTRARYPVVYMHDGQNLFDPAAAFGGNPWLVQDALNGGAEDGTIREAIVVGPESTADRIGEYTPTPDPSYPGGGKGALYLRFLVEELKPKVDAELRTRPGRDDTAIVGASLGGLISAFAGVQQPQTFGLVGAMSPSTWWNNLGIVGSVAATPPAPARPLRVYLDVGTDNDGEPETAQLVSAYRALGYVDGATLLYVVQQGASHNETYWRQRLPNALRFLLGPGR